MQWGVPQVSINPGGSQITHQKRYPFAHEVDEQFDRKIVNEIGDDGNHYYTEYSQVSAIETGFKKLKTNQI